ncbi:ATP-binding protein, partial [Streptomyces alkaliphilus]
RGSVGRRERLRRRQREHFVGRRGELAVFEANLRRDPGADDYEFVFHVRGQAGVGKSTLVRRWRGQAEERGALCVLLADEMPGPVAVMTAIARDLSRQGAELREFDKRLETYWQRRREAESAALPGVDGEG